MIYITIYKIYLLNSISKLCLCYFGIVVCTVVILGRVRVPSVVSIRIFQSGYFIVHYYNRIRNRDIFLSFIPSKKQRCGCCFFLGRNA